MGQSTLARRSDGAWGDARAWNLLLFFSREEVHPWWGRVGSPGVGAASSRSDSPSWFLALPAGRLLQVELAAF